MDKAGSSLLIAHGNQVRIVLDPFVDEVRSPSQRFLQRSGGFLWLVQLGIQASTLRRK